VFSTTARKVATVAVAVAMSATPMLVTGSPAAAAVAPKTPAAAVALPVAIEDMPSYQPQTVCDPVAKPGVVALGALLTATYPDTSVVSTARSCTSESGTSEHKDGRALDWAASYQNPQQVAEVHAVFSWLFAADAQGNPHAMLRRLGIMYIIWNKQIWGTWSQSWQPYSCSGVTACHQDHVHFSFDWAGALKKTSFWTGVVAPPMAPPPYVYTSSAFPQIVSVGSRRTSHLTTPFLVRAGLRYKFTVSGTYRYAASTTAPAGALRADAECSTSDGKTWSALATGDTSGSTGLLDLWVAGRRLWWPTVASGGGCNATNHTYTRTLTFPTTAGLQLWVNDPTHGDDLGALKVVVQRV
jgi:hypothetical protein